MPKERRDGKNAQPCWLTFASGHLFNGTPLACLFDVSLFANAMFEAEIWKKRMLSVILSSFWPNCCNFQNLFQASSNWMWKMQNCYSLTHKLVREIVTLIFRIIVKHMLYSQLSLTNGSLINPMKMRSIWQCKT